MCFFFYSNQVEYLGHVISKAKMSTNSQKIKAILEWDILSNIKQLRGSLGLTGYYRIFIRGYDTICKTLTNLLKKQFLQVDGRCNYNLQSTQRYKL